MSSPPKSDSLNEELPEVTRVVKEEFEKKLQEQRQQDEDKPEDDDATELQWQQQDIDAAARIDDLTTQIDVYENSLRIDRRHLDEMNRANEFTAQSRFAQPPEVTAQGKILETTPAPTRGRITKALVSQAFDLLPAKTQDQPNIPPPPKVLVVEITAKNYLNDDELPDYIPTENITYMGRRYARACRDAPQ